MTYQNGAKFYQVGWVRMLIKSQIPTHDTENLFGTANIWV